MGMGYAGLEFCDEIINMQMPITHYLKVESNEIDSPKSELIRSKVVEGRSAPSYLPISYDGVMNGYFTAMAGHELGGPNTMLWISNLCVQMGKFYAPGLSPQSDNPDSAEKAPPAPTRSDVKFLEVKKSSFLITPHEAAHNFFHFLIDSLPRFAFKEKFAKFNTPILFTGLREPFHDNAMSVLLRKRYPIHQSSYRLLLRECATVWPLSRAAAVDFLQKKSTHVAVNTDVKRIYISRRNALYRQVRNELELEPILDKFGFTIIECETLTFSKQISLFKAAEIVCGPHGAGLTNIAFCQKNTSVLEILMEERLSINVGSAFWELACAGKLDYHILSANRVPIDESNGIDGAMHVDPIKFEAALDYLIAHRK